MPNTEEPVRFSGSSSGTIRNPPMGGLQQRLNAHATGSTQSQASGGVDKLIPFADEVVGRRLAMRKGRAWAAAIITGYDSGKHTLKMDTGSTVVVSLGACKFKWTSGPPDHAAPNPSWACAPAPKTAVGRKVQIFWPAMGRYYTGVIKSYDEASGRHAVDYSDGDSSEHDLRHESVVWVETAFAAHGKPNASPPSNNSSRRRQQQQQQQPDSPASGKLEPSGAHTGRKRAAAAAAGVDGSDVLAKKRRASRAATSGGQQGEDGVLDEEGVEMAEDEDAEQREEEQEEEEEEEEDEKVEEKGEQSADEAATFAEGGDALKITVGARIGLTSDGGKTYLRGDMSGYHPSDGRHRLRFDDASNRLLNMRGKEFAWLAPRSKAAGYSPRLHAAMVHLGATNVLPRPAPHPPAAAAANHKPTSGTGDGSALQPQAALPAGFRVCTAAGPRAALGKLLCLFWPGDGRWYPAEVLHQDPDSGLHRVLYCDGENEWVDLKAEHIAWAQSGSNAALPYGICAGGFAPESRAAVGWHVSVWSSDDACFQDGCVTSYDARNDLLTVEYHEGQEEEAVSAQRTKIVWKAAPASAMAASPSSTAAAPLSTAQPGRSKRVTAGRLGRQTPVAAAVKPKGLTQGGGRVRGASGGRGRHTAQGRNAGGSASSSEAEAGPHQSEEEEEEEEVAEDDGGMASDWSAEEAERRGRRIGNGKAHTGGQAVVSLAEPDQQVVTTGCSSPTANMKPVSCFGSPFQPQAAAAALEQQQFHHRADRASSKLGQGSGDHSAGTGLFSGLDNKLAPLTTPQAVPRTPGLPTPPQQTPPQALGFSFPTTGTMGLPAGAAASAANSWAAALMDIKRQMQLQQAAAAVAGAGAGTGASGAKMPPPPLTSMLQRHQQQQQQLQQQQQQQQQALAGVYLQAVQAHAQAVQSAAAGGDSGADCNAARAATTAAAVAAFTAAARAACSGLNPSLNPSAGMRGAATAAAAAAALGTGASRLLAGAVIAPAMPPVTTQRPGLAQPPAPGTPPSAEQPPAAQLQAPEVQQAQEQAQGGAQQQVPGQTLTQGQPQGQEQTQAQLQARGPQVNQQPTPQNKDAEPEVQSLPLLRARLSSLDAMLRRIDACGNSTPAPVSGKREQHQRPNREGGSCKRRQTLALPAPAPLNLPGPAPAASPAGNLVSTVVASFTVAATAPVQPASAVKTTSKSAAATPSAATSAPSTIAPGAACIDAARVMLAPATARKSSNNARPAGDSPASADLGDGVTGKGDTGSVATVVANASPAATAAVEVVQLVVPPTAEQPVPAGMVRSTEPGRPMAAEGAGTGLVGAGQGAQSAVAVLPAVAPAPVTLPTSAASDAAVAAAAAAAAAAELGASATPAAVQTGALSSATLASAAQAVAAAPITEATPMAAAAVAEAAAAGAGALPAATCSHAGPKPGIAARQAAPDTHCGSQVAGAGALPGGSGTPAVSPQPDGVRVGH